MELHELIANKRKEQGLSLEQLSAKVGLSKQALDAIEKGSNAKHVKRVIDLLNALGVAVFPSEGQSGSIAKSVRPERMPLAAPAKAKTIEDMNIGGYKPTPYQVSQWAKINNANNKTK